MSKSSLASVLFTKARKKVEDSEPLAQFHKKFWGKGIEDEEAEWRRETDLGSGGQSEDEAMDSENIDENDDDEDEEDIDEDDDNDEEDIIPGCCVLDIGIEDIKPSRIWVRADYVRIYDYCEEVYNKSGTLLSVAVDGLPSVVLTGHPGIGKKAWIIYATRRRAAEKKPFLWLFRGIYHLFVDEGVYELPVDWEHDNFCTTIWTFIGTDESVDGVQSKTVDRFTRFFVIYATYPDLLQFLRMAMATKNTILVMNPWAKREILRVASLRASTQPGVDIEDVFDRFGPIPRLCLDFTVLELQEYEKAVDAAILKVTSDTNQMKKLFKNARMFAMDEVSDKVFLISRKKRDNITSPLTLSPITRYIGKCISRGFLDADTSESELLSLIRFVGQK